MILRQLARHELENIWTIDRSEVHHHIYQWRDNQLVLTPAYFEAHGWAPGQVERDTPSLYACFDRGGWFYGLFDGDQLIAAVVLDNKFIGPRKDLLQLKAMHVSCNYRGHGLGRRLFELAKEKARSRGAKGLYISATPSEHTIHFYLRLGCIVMPTPDPELFALESGDIHLECEI